jgi:hypothetical protein
MTGALIQNIRCIFERMTDVVTKWTTATNPKKYDNDDYASACSNMMEQTHVLHAYNLLRTTTHLPYRAPA